MSWGLYAKGRHPGSKKIIKIQTRYSGVSGGTGTYAARQHVHSVPEVPDAKVRDNPWSQCVVKAQGQRLVANFRATGKTSSAQIWSANIKAKCSSFRSFESSKTVATKDMQILADVLVITNVKLIPIENIRATRAEVINYAGQIGQWDVSQQISRLL